MRKRFASLISVSCFFFFLSFSNAKAQVFNGNLTLNSQADVDAFNYNSVTGILFISNISSNITNLDGLSTLTSVGTNILISRQSHLMNLNGLSNLQSVTGILSIGGCPNLENIDGLSSLQSVGTLRIGGLQALERNLRLKNINGISSLTTCRSIAIVNNDSLTSIDPLLNFSSFLGDLIINNNPLLTNLNALSNITSVGGDLHIGGSGLTDINGLSNLTSVGGDLRLGGVLAGNQGLPLLTTIDALSNLTSMHGSLEIVGTGVTHVNALANIKQGLNFVMIERNSSLVNIDGLSGITSLSNGLFIESNVALTNINGLSNLTSIGGRLWIVSNRSLQNLNGLSGLTSVGSHIDIRENRSLIDFCGLYNLFNSGTISGTIIITNNGANTVGIAAQDITINNDPGLCSAVVPAATIGDPTVAGCLKPGTPEHSDFPTGNIFSVGTTTITWKVTDGAGNTASVNQTITVLDVQVPVISCPGNRTVACASDVPAVDINSVTATDNCSVIVEHVSDVVSNQTCANRFTLTRTYKATDPSGNSAACSQVITVNDDIPPQLTGLNVSQEVLWPPNHKMQDITVSYTATDNCVSSPIVTVTVISNESVNGTGDGDTAPDWEITDNHHIKLRAERAANGNGRIYTITITVDDGCNSPVSESKQVFVAHNITGPQSGKPFKVGSTVPFSGEFWDKPGNTHTAKWLLDGSAVANGAVTEPEGNQNGKVTGAYKFRSTGVYKLQMNITDQNGITSFANTNEDVDAIVVIYDPNGGYTYGGGYYDSPAGALASNPAATGKASYGFAMNYFKNSTYPKGETQFEFKVGDFEFNALNFDYLVISNSMAQFKGTGKIIGGQSGVGFTMTVVDGEFDGTGVDKIRMKIYNKNNGNIIYDNQFGASDAAFPTQAVGANSTVVISGTNSSLTKSDHTTQNAEMEVNTEKPPTPIDVIAFSNPSANNFSIMVQAVVKGKLTMQVTDIYGRVIETRIVIANSLIRLGDRYRPGTYFVRIVQGNGHKVVKLVKLSD